MPKAPKPVLPAAPKIEMWAPERLIPYPRNTKRHPEDEVARLAATINRFGWDQPIVVDAAGVIIKGHGRRLAALSLKLAQVPVWVRDDLTQDEADAARIADNAVAGLQFDTRLMQEELQRLLVEGATFSIDELGLGEKDKKLLMEQLDAPELTSLIDDTTAVVEEQKDEDAERVAKADSEEVSVATALGFKRVTRAEERLIARGLANAEARYACKGKDALIKMFENAA